MEVTLSVIILAVGVMVVTSAPAEGPAMDKDKERVLQEYYRERRSQYPQNPQYPQHPQYPQYVTPCAAAAAASSPIPAIAPTAYQVNLSPYHPYSAPAHSYYGMPHYRSLDFEPEQEMMSYSDMDHMMSEHVPMARYGYAAPAATHSLSYAPLPAATSGPAFGVFPNAKTGGCSVPLLFSCTPSIIPGRVVQNQPQGYGNAYRGVEPIAHHDSQDSHEEPAAQEHLTPVHDPSQTSQAVHQ